MSAPAHVFCRRVINFCQRVSLAVRVVRSLPTAMSRDGASCYSLCGHWSVRCFWGPFLGQKQETVKEKNAAQHARIVQKAHRNASLHNERLLDACLDLLSFCGSSDLLHVDDNDGSTRDIIAAVVETTLHDLRKNPAEQFDLVYTALCLPLAVTNRQVHHCLMVILEAFLPEALFRVFESENLIVLGPEGAARRDVLIRFVHALLGCAEVPDGVESEELLFVYMDDVIVAFPSLRNNPAFVELEANATTIAMKARLYTLLSQLCAEFDKEGTGKVSFVELMATARQVLGEDKAHMLLEGAQPDKDGNICYAQLTSLLTRPPPGQK